MCVRACVCVVCVCVHVCVRTCVYVCVIIIVAHCYCGYHSEQLMWYHQSLFSAMMRIDQSTDAYVSSEFLNTLDKFLPGLTVYTPFLALGQQTFQHVSSIL